MNHKVGQIIFLLDNSEMKIFPARIEEEIVRRTVGSEEISHKVLLPDKARSVVSLSDLDVSVFTSLTDLRHHMIENATRTIDRLIERSKIISQSLEIPGSSPEEIVRED